MPDKVRGLQTGLLVILLCVQSSTLAALLHTERPFSFGRIAITGNERVSKLHLPAHGQPIAMHDIYVLERGESGVYAVEGLPPFRQIVLQSAVPIYSKAERAGSEPLIIQALDLPERLQADAQGQVRFVIGGVLQTTGSGRNYLSPATHNFFIPIEITY